MCILFLLQAWLLERGRLLRSSKGWASFCSLSGTQVFTGEGILWYGTNASSEVSLVYSQGCPRLYPLLVDLWSTSEYIPKTTPHKYEYWYLSK